MVFVVCVCFACGHKLVAEDRRESGQSLLIFIAFCGEF